MTRRGSLDSSKEKWGPHDVAPLYRDRPQLDSNRTPSALPRRLNLRGLPRTGSTPAAEIALRGAPNVTAVQLS